MTDPRDDGAERPETLSDRAVAWLGALRRERPVSLLRVHRALDEAGVPAFEPWLEFHDRYAGYAVPVGADGAVWGLMHDAPRFWPRRVPGSLDVERDDDDGLWTIACADAHPSHEQRLDERGVLLAGPVSRFDVYVEQKALWAEFCAASPAPRVHFGRIDEALAERLETRAERVPEASDDYQEYRRGDDVLGVRDLETMRWTSALSR